MGGGGIAVAPFSFASFYSAAEFTLNQKHLTFCNSLPLFVPLSLSPTLQQTTAQSATMGTAVLRYSTSRELGVGGLTRCGSERIWGGGLVRRDWIAIISNIALISDYVAQ